MHKIDTRKFRYQFDFLVCIGNALECTKLKKLSIEIYTNLDQSDANKCIKKQEMVPGAGIEPARPF